MIVRLGRLCRSPIVQKSILSVRRIGRCDSNAIVLMCRSQANPQKLSPTYECKHESKKTGKFYWEKQSYKNRYHRKKSCPVQLESGTLKVSCHRINYRSKIIEDDCCTIVRLSSDAIVQETIVLTLVIVIILWQVAYDQMFISLYYGCKTLKQIIWVWKTSNLGVWSCYGSWLAERQHSIKQQLCYLYDCWRA